MAHAVTKKVSIIHIVKAISLWLPFIGALTVNYDYCTPTSARVLIGFCVKSALSGRVKHRYTFQTEKKNHIFRRL